MDNLQNPICKLPGIKDIVNIIPKNLLGASILNPTDLPIVFEDIAEKLKLPVGLPKLPTDGILGGGDKPKLPTDVLLGGGDKKGPIGQGILPIGDNQSGGNQGSGGLLSGGGLFGPGNNSGKSKQSPSTTRGPSLGLGSLIG